MTARFGFRYLIAGNKSVRHNDSSKRDHRVGLKGERPSSRAMAKRAHHRR
ncbi:MAG: hypothetical protein ABSG76_04070 [Xanthobacteraceae bacterium]|jgi:hypothetical protein